MTNSLDLQKFMDKIKTAEKSHTLDLSSGEDLSIAIMNLISLEEHMFFNANKTGKVKYFELLQEIRKMRVSLLKTIIKDYEGEVWCTSKHLLAASMRLLKSVPRLRPKVTPKLPTVCSKNPTIFTIFLGNKSRRCQKLRNCRRPSLFPI